MNLSGVRMLLLLAAVGLALFVALSIIYSGPDTDCQATVLNFKSFDQEVPGFRHAHHARESGS